MNDPNTDTKTLVHRCRTEGIDAIVEFYEQHRDEFLAYGQRFSTDRDLLLSAYHDAVIIFYEKMIAHQYDSSVSQPKTYLFTIARYQLFNALKKQQRPTISIDQLNIAHEITIELEKESLNAEEQLLKTTFQQLGKKCKELLTLFYYHSCSLPVIQERMNYNNLNVVYSHKSRCLKHLKELLLIQKKKG